MAHKTQREHQGILIPAAGFGVRMGRPEAKEMLPDPNSAEPAPMIAWALRHFAGRYPLKVLTRPEKKNLIDYLTSEWPMVKLVLGQPGQDWPETILQAEKHWFAWNLVLLPDTRFAPIEVVDQMLQDQAPLSYARHSGVPSEVWGYVEGSHQSETAYIYEKCSDAPGLAWGLLGFLDEYGVRALAAHSQSQREKQGAVLPLAPKFYDLREFRDISRGAFELF